MKSLVAVFLLFLSAAASGSEISESGEHGPVASNDYKRVDVIDLMLDAEAMVGASIESKAWVQFFGEDLIHLKRPEKGRHEPLSFNAVEGDGLSRADRLHLRDSCSAEPCKLFLRGVVSEDSFGDHFVELVDVNQSDFQVGHKAELLKLVEKGEVEIETRDLRVSQIPEISQLSPGTLGGFRGSVNIPEGEWGDVAFIGLKDGYVVQKLPFKIEVEDFHVEFYDNGEPKSFSSALTLTDKKTGEATAETVRVNHPLRYKGYRIFQSSFGDGGTEFTFDAWQLAGDIGTHQELEGKVNQDRVFNFNGKKFTLDVRDFSLSNVNPTEGPDGNRENTKFGPSITFRLRDASGQAIEYENYFQPVEFDGTKYFLSGVTPEVGAQQQFLFIPADRNDSIETFMAFYATLKDREEITRIAGDLVGQTSQGQQGGAAQSAAARSIADMVETFVEQGFSALGEQVDRQLAERDMPPEMAGQARESSFRVVQSVLMRAYMETLQEQGVDEFGDRDKEFFEKALDVVTVIPNYGSPIYVAPKSFNHIPSSGLEIRKE